MMRRNNRFIDQMRNFRHLVGYFLFLERPKVPLQILWEEMTRTVVNTSNKRRELIDMINQLAERDTPGCTSPFARLTKIEGDGRMAMINVYVDEATHKRLLKIAEEKDRQIEDLAESAVAEAALDSFRHRNDDPGRA